MTSLVFCLYVSLLTWFPPSRLTLHFLRLLSYEMYSSLFMPEVFGMFSCLTGLSDLWFAPKLRTVSLPMPSPYSHTLSLSQVNFVSGGSSSLWATLRLHIHSLASSLLSSFCIALQAVKVSGGFHLNLEAVAPCVFCIFIHVYKITKQDWVKSRTARKPLAERAGSQVWQVWGGMLALPLVRPRPH